MINRIRINYQNEIIDFNPSHYKSLLDFILSKGYSMKYSCKMGFCGLCRITVLEGESKIKHFQDPLLECEQKDEFLACCCQVTDDISILI